MQSSKVTSNEEVLLAIDVSKRRFDLLLEASGQRRRKFKIQNTLHDYKALGELLRSYSLPVRVGLEATGNFHRTIAYFLEGAGFEVQLVSSLALARTREALTNSWDKNDPKDAQVILYMLKNKIVQLYHDPLRHGYHDIQEISKTYALITLRKTMIQHSVLNHFLPLYFPEAEKYFQSSRLEWFINFLKEYPCPATIVCLPEDQFIKEAWAVKGRKVSKKQLLQDIYSTAKTSVALPIDPDSLAIKAMKLVLDEYQNLVRRRSELEDMAHQHLEGQRAYEILRSIPGIGPVIALTILAEAGDLTRFRHHRQFLKYCGLDLSTQQSGQYRGRTKLSKRGNSRLRTVFWMAATISTRLGQNSFRAKYERLIANDPQNPDRKRTAYIAVAAKIARVAHSLIKLDQFYRPFPEEAVPGVGIPNSQAMGANRTP